MSTALILACLVAFVSGLLLTRSVRVVAQAFGTLDVPNERSSHATPTPRGGGISFVVITLLVAAYVSYTTRSVSLAIYAVSALGVALVSLFDDVRSLPAIMRLAIHFAAAGAFVVLVRPFGFMSQQSLVIVIAILWIVSLTNIFNFMDGIDGIAASQGVVTFSSMGIYALVRGHDALALVALVASFAIAGFLAVNWPPARIFMGDVGSAFLGFSCGCLAIVSGDVGMVLVAVCATWPFVFDSTLTLARRLIRGENVLRSHRSHLYQRLVIAGRSQRFVTTLYAVCAAAGASAGLLGSMSLMPIFMAVVTAAIVSVALLVLVRRAESRMTSAAIVQAPGFSK